MKSKRKLPQVLADLKASEANPRNITVEAMEGLKVSVTEFGDISGIVFNTRTGRLVAGHQRVDALRGKYGADIAIKPDGDGGSIETAGGAFRVRFVDWDDAKSEAAMLVANNPEIQGDWTDGVMAMLETMKTETVEMFAGLKLDELMGDIGSRFEEMVPPADFKEVDENIATEHECPKCKYRWSGKSNA